MKTDNSGKEYFMMRAFHVKARTILFDDNEEWKIDKVAEMLRELSHLKAENERLIQLLENIRNGRPVYASNWDMKVIDQINEVLQSRKKLNNK